MMRKSIRLFITGNMQSMYFKQFIKENADKNNVRGFMRNLEDGRVEIFLEGMNADVDSMVSICKTGPKFTQVRSVETKEERYQDFKDFKVLSF